MCPKLPETVGIVGKHKLNTFQLQTGTDLWRPICFNYRPQSKYFSSHGNSSIVGQNQQLRKQEEANHTSWLCFAYQLYNDLLHPCEQILGPTLTSSALQFHLKELKGANFIRWFISFARFVYEFHLDNKRMWYTPGVLVECVINILDSVFRISGD